MLASLSPSAEDADDEEEDGCEELLVRMPPAGEDAISLWPPRPGPPGQGQPQQQLGRLAVPSSVATIEGAIAAQQRREHRQQQELTEELMTSGNDMENRKDQ